MIRSRPFAMAATTLAAALILTACAPTPSPTPTATVTVTETATPSPTPTPTQSAKPATFPTSCATIGTAATRAATVDPMTLQGDGTGFTRPAPQGATLKLGCDWIVGDATGILILISQAPSAAAVTTAVGTLPGQGYTCSTAKAGNPLCDMTTTNSQYGTKTMETIYARDDVWIYMSASNIDGGQLLSDLAVEMWK
ncbi:hypothetical protein [Microbacterium sp. CJ88]|uniref:hypothetical protein n=1 Tax=Microbacterium sp. CJ88 TaxID=3445672 RepID=UPI003F65D5A5